MRPRHIAQLTARPIASILCCVALTSLPACQPRGPDAPFANYLGKLSAALAITAPDSPPDAPPTPPQMSPLIPSITPPQASTLQLAIPASRIESLDFLQLSGCDVQANIGKRQISLGQLAKPSQRLLLELEYLRLAPACISRLRDSNNPVLADVLEAAWQEKQAQLPAVIFNATLGGDEYRAFWLALPAPGDYPRSSPDDVAAAMRAINDQTQRWLSGDYRADNRDFELRLSEVAGGDGGMRLQEWARQIDWLAAADSMVEQAIASETLCSEHNPNPKGLRRTAIAHTYFTDVTQPVTALSQRRFQETVAPVTALERQLSAALPPIYRRWTMDRSQRVATLASAPVRHLERLNRLQQACATE